MNKMGEVIEKARVWGEGTKKGLTKGSPFRKRLEMRLEGFFKENFIAKHQNIAIWMIPVTIWPNFDSCCYYPCLAIIAFAAGCTITSNHKAQIRRWCKREIKGSPASNKEEVPWTKGMFLDRSEKGWGGVSHGYESRRGQKGFLVSGQKVGFKEKGEVMR